VTLRPTDKGNIAEAHIAAAAIEFGIDVLKPLTEGTRYDLVFDAGPRLLRIQCKWARRKGNVVAVPLSTSRLTPRGYVKTTYTAEEIDAFAAYCPDLRRCFCLPIREFEGQFIAHLRLAPTGNNQAVRIKWAADYELGAIAQLGERRAGSAKVAGSSPASSTEEAAHQGGLFVLPDP
jgi:hypothetical protein